MTLPPFLLAPPSPPVLIKPVVAKPWTKRQLVKRFGEYYARKVFALRGEKW